MRNRLQEIFRCFPEFPSATEGELSENIEHANEEDWILRLELSVQKGKLTLFLPQSIIALTIEKNLGHLRESQTGLSVAAQIVAFLYLLMERLEGYLQKYADDVALSSVKRLGQFPVCEPLFRYSFWCDSKRQNVLFSLEQSMIEECISYAEVAYPTPSLRRIENIPFLRFEFFLLWKLERLDRLLEFSVGTAFVLEEAHSLVLKVPSEHDRQRFSFELENVNLRDSDIRIKLSGGKNMEQKLNGERQGNISKNIFPRNEIGVNILLGRVKLSIQQLIDLSPGTVLSLPLELPQTLSVSLGDRAIAKVVPRRDGDRGYLLEVVEIFTEGNEASAQKTTIEETLSPSGR